MDTPNGMNIGANCLILSDFCYKEKELNSMSELSSEIF